MMNEVQKAGASKPENVTFRRLSAADRDRIETHFLRLDLQARRRRFTSMPNEGFIREYANQLPERATVAYGAFVEGELRGVGELYVFYEKPKFSAESAFSVENSWQGQGIGHALADRIVAAAQNRGVMSLYMMCLPDNIQMRRIAEKHHAIFQYSSESVEAFIVPPWPTPLSLTKEFLL